MRRVGKRFAVAVVLSLMVFLLVSSVASASYSDKQNTPGTTTRTIWDSNQVAIYKLPTGINHTGYVHFELKFKPNWADFDVYLIGPANKALNMEQGYNASFTGKEYIDFEVRTIRNQTIVDDGYGDRYMVGDTYYVVVVAFNEAAKFQLWGYYPQIDLDVSATTNAKDNFWLTSFRKPSDTDAWINLKGAPYGKPWDFVPTSQGTAYVGLEWPADVTNKKVTYDPVNAPSPANYESYVYAGADWDSVFEVYGDAYFTPPAQVAMPPWWPTAWYGHFNAIDIAPGDVGPDAGPPLLTYHFIPSLFLTAADPAAGITGLLKTGKSTVGYKATIIYPENLRMTSAPGSVKKGASATLKGRYALDGAWAANTKVEIWTMKYGGSNYKLYGSVKTDADGYWQMKVKISQKSYWMAQALGNPLTGLAVEKSWRKLISVK